MTELRPLPAKQSVAATQPSSAPSTHTAHKDNEHNDLSNTLHIWWQHQVKRHGVPFRRVVKGFSLLPLGAIRACQQSSFLRLFGYALLAQVVCFLLLRLATLLIAIGPLGVAWLVGRLLFGAQHPFTAAMSITIERVNEWTAVDAPFLLLLSLRYLRPELLDSVFMQAMSARDPTLGTLLASRPFRYQYWPEFKAFLRRSLRQLRGLLVMRLAGAVPVIGALLVGLVSFYMTRRAFGRKLACVYAALALLPGGRWYATRLMAAVIGARQLARELMEPYFVRMSMDGRMRRDWFRHRNAATFGFAVLAYVLMQQAWMNLLVFLVAQAAIVELVVSPEVLSRKPPKTAEHSHSD